MGCDLCVSSIVPIRETLFPASSSFRWVALASLPHHHQYYCQLRLPYVHLRFVRFSLSLSDTLFCPSFLFVSLTFIRLVSVAGLPTLRQDFVLWLDLLLPSFLHRETYGSPKFPGYPFKHMPWSMTPVVSWILAFTHPGLLPSVKDKTSAFSSHEDYSYIHKYTLFGAQYRACVLDSFGLGLPLPVLPPNFTTGLLAKLWPGGIFLIQSYIEKKALERWYPFIWSPTGQHYRLSWVIFQFRRSTFNLAQILVG